MHFSGDRSDTDTSYYGIYVAIPVWNEVVVYHYYIYDVRDANGKMYPVEVTYLNLAEL